MRQKQRIEHRESIFDQAKARLPDMREIARFYGYEANGRGYLCCPFHVEKTPSMLLHKDSFKCFGCGAHGDAIDFVSQLFQENARDAVKRLDRDFCLRLDVARAPDAAELRKRERIAEIRQQFEKWKLETLNCFDKCIRTANTADISRADKLTDAETVAVRYKESLEYWADVLLHGDMGQQMSIFRDREEVERLCKMILSSTPTKSATA